MAAGMLATCAFSQDLVRAEELYKHTDFEESLNILDKKSNEFPRRPQLLHDW
jgi:hypothetical protein